MVEHGRHKLCRRCRVYADVLCGIRRVHTTARRTKYMCYVHTAYCATCAGHKLMMVLPVRRSLSLSVYPPHRDQMMNPALPVNLTFTVWRSSRRVPAHMYNVLNVFWSITPQLCWKYVAHTARTSTAHAASRGGLQRIAIIVHVMMLSVYY